MATEAKPLSNAVKHEYPFKNLTRKEVTVTVGAGDTLKVGQLMGEITATGKFVVAVETAVDGSEAFGGILADLQDGSRERTFADAGDYILAVVDKGPAQAASNGIIFDASYDNQTKQDVILGQMEAAGISIVENAEIGPLL